jgi:hypothetical protein
MIVDFVAVGCRSCSIDSREFLAVACTAVAAVRVPVQLYGTYSTDTDTEYSYSRTTVPVLDLVAWILLLAPPNANVLDLATTSRSSASIKVGLGTFLFHHKGWRTQECTLRTWCNAQIIITNVEMSTSTRCVAVSIWQYYLVIVLKKRLYIGFPAWNKNVPQSISLRISLHACRFWLAG